MQKHFSGPVVEEAMVTIATIRMKYLAGFPKSSFNIASIIHITIAMIIAVVR